MNFKIGDKVVPIGKTAGDPMEESGAWDMAKEQNQPFLFVRDITLSVYLEGRIDTSRASGPCRFVLTCSHSESGPGGDYFFESDLLPYEAAPPRPKTVLAEAESLIYGDREKDYGKVSDNFTDIAKGWEVITKANITPEQVGLMMAWLKICRANKDNCEKRDSLVDLAGYAGCIDKVKQGL